MGWLLERVSRAARLLLGLVGWGGLLLRSMVLLEVGLLVSGRSSLLVSSASRRRINWGWLWWEMEAWVEKGCAGCLARAA